MGYRSDLHLVADEDTWAKFVLVLGAKHVTELRSYADTFQVLTANNISYQHLEMSSIKWYPGYALVDAVNEAIEEVHDARDARIPHGRGIGMVRVGEGDGNEPDIEEYGSPHEVGLYLSSPSINWEI